MGKKKQRNSNRQQSKALQSKLGDLEIMPTPEFMAKHEIRKVKLDKNTYAMRHDKRPIDKYHRLYCIDQERGIAENSRSGINEDQFRAADRLARNYERCFSKTVLELSPVRVQTTINIGMYPIESIAQAIHQHTRIMQQLSTISREIIEDVCCQEKKLLEYEHKKNWKKGYGMTRLREALDELMEAYRTGGNRNSAKNI